MRKGTMETQEQVVIVCPETYAVVEAADCENRIPVYRHVSSSKREYLSPAVRRHRPLPPEVEVQLVRERPLACQLQLFRVQRIISAEIVRHDPGVMRDKKCAAKCEDILARAGSQFLGPVGFRLAI